MVETLIETTKFDLPSDFLKRWIKSTGESKLTEEEAKAEYERSEKGLRYQLIEGKLREENKSLQITFEELKSYANNMIKAQMIHKRSVRLIQRKNRYIYGVEFYEFNAFFYSQSER